MIDKTKAYRFKGDSERWEWARSNKRLRDEKCTCTLDCRTVDHLLDKGILLEYPELPGEDWEFCERSEAGHWWCDIAGGWSMNRDKAICKCDVHDIYCRKKKPVYRSGIFEAGSVPSTWADGAAIYWTTDPDKGKELLK